MDDVNLKLDEKSYGAFYIMDGLEQMAEMVVRISGNRLIVYHTEVSDKAEGKGLARKLLAAMAAYARSNQLKVIPLCPYVHAEFKRHPEEYTDIWSKDVEKEKHE